MKLLIETCLSDLMIFLINDSNVIDEVIKKEMVYKSDNLDSLVKNMLERNNLEIAKDIKAIYVTNGPGSFMGIRAGLMYCLTLSKLNNIPLHVLSSLEFIQIDDESAFWEAKGNQSYQLKDKQISLVQVEKNSQFDIAHFKKNIVQILNRFQLIDPLLVKANYVKEPKIG